MLFGAGLAPCSKASRLVTLNVSRNIYKQTGKNEADRYQMRTVGWILALLGLHDIRMLIVDKSSSVDQIDNKLTYKSSGIDYLWPIFKRWYPQYEIERSRWSYVPPDINLCEKSFAVWLVDALHNNRPGSDIRLSSMRMRHHVASILAWHVRRLGWPCKISATTRYFALDIPAETRPDLEAWLEQYVPAEVWTNETE